MGLNESFSQVRGQLLLMDPLPPINKVFALISQEEKQRTVMTNMGAPILFHVKHDHNKANQGRFQKKDKSLCTHCGLHGHTIEKCYKLHGYQKKDKSLCTHCGLHGHIIEKCYKLHGYPPGYKVRSKNPNGQNFLTPTN